MACFFPAVFMIVMTVQGPEKTLIPKPVLHPEIVKAIEEGHAKCRKRKIGHCLVEVNINTSTGKTIFQCGDSKDTQALN